MVFLVWENRSLPDADQNATDVTVRDVGRKGVRFASERARATNAYEANKQKCEVCFHNVVCSGLTTKS